MPIDVFLLYLVFGSGAAVLGAVALLLLCVALVMVIHLVPQLCDVDEEQ